MNVALRASMLVMVSALAVVWAACGGDADDEAVPTKMGGAAGTAAATTAAKPTSAATPAGAAEKYGDLSTQQQSSINNLCVWATTAAAGDLTAEEPFVGLVDARGMAAAMRAGQLGKTFEQHGEALADVAEIRDPAELKAVGTDISAACEEIGWTAS
jgi:hypothetical protein